MAVQQLPQHDDDRQALEEAEALLEEARSIYDTRDARLGALALILIVAVMFGVYSMFGEIPGSAS